jgi:ubiquinone/menaquinone biosynthesis C-methylase UbiE
VSAQRGGRRLSLGEIVAGYDRVARFYRVLEPLYLIFPPARRKAVAALGLQRGSTVLEIGAGTGRCLVYLTRAIGPAGAVIAVDASAGMLGQARRLVQARQWANVELVHQDAARLEVGHDVDGVLFSLSYSVLPDPARVLALAWERLRPGGRIVVMDAGLPGSLLGRLLGPPVSLLLRLAPGDPHSRPWDDLGRYGPVGVTRFMAGLYFICVVTKPAAVT